MLTEENFRRNLETAKKNVVRDLGLDTSKPFNYEDRTRYNKALAAQITRYPKSFSPAQLEIARRILDQHDYEPLEDTGFSFTDFAKETVANAPKVLSGFSEGVLKIALGIAIVWLIFKASTSRAAMKS